MVRGRPDRCALPHRGRSPPGACAPAGLAPAGDFPGRRSAQAHQGKEGDIMSNKKKAAAVDRAVATIKQSTHTDAQKVSVAGTLAQEMAKSPDWAAATDVQAAVK